MKHEHIEAESFEHDILSFPVTVTCNKNGAQIWESVFTKSKKVELLQKYPDFPDDLCPKSLFLQYDRPDIIIPGDDFVIGVEHFSFDASKRTRHGSKMKSEHERICKQLRNQLNIDLSLKHVEEIIPVDLSFQFYLKSWFEAYINHLSKVNIYKNRLKELYPHKTVYLAFLMEDITAVGNYVKWKDNIQALSPLFVERIINIIHSAPLIDFAIAKYKEAYCPCIEILSTDGETLQKRLSECYDKDAHYIAYSYSTRITGGRK